MSGGGGHGGQGLRAGPTGRVPGCNARRWVPAPQGRPLLVAASGSSQRHIPHHLPKTPALRAHLRHPLARHVQQRGRLVVVPPPPHHKAIKQAAPGLVLEPQDGRRAGGQLQVGCWQNLRAGCGGVGGWGGELRGRAAHRGLLFGEGPLSVLPECSPAHHTPPAMLQLAPGRAAPHTRRAGPRGAQRAHRAPAGRRAAPARQPRGPPCCMPRLHQREAGRIHGSPPASEAQCTGSGGGLRPRGGAR